MEERLKRRGSREEPGWKGSPHSLFPPSRQGDLDDLSGPAPRCPARCCRLRVCRPYTAIKQGSYTRHFHSPQYPQDDGSSPFATLTNPYAFATTQVRHVLRTQECGALTREDFEDAVQDALL